MIVEAQLGGQRGPATGDPRLHRADRDVEHLGDLGVVEVGDIAEHDRDPQVIRQLVECVVEQEPIGESFGVQVGHRINGLGPVSLVDRVQARPALAFAEFVERRIGRDAVGPGAERGATVEARKVANDLDQRLLTSIVGIACPAGDPAAHGVDPVVVTAQQLIERETITALCGGDQGGVIELARNAASVTNGSEASRDVRCTWVARTGRAARPVGDRGSADDGDLAEATPIRVRVAAGSVATELLEQDQDVSGGCCRHG